MKACAEATRPRGIKTIVSLNPIMVDGTGMCGGCRVKVGRARQVRLRRRPGLRWPSGGFRRSDDEAEPLQGGGAGSDGTLDGKLPHAQRGRGRSVGSAAQPGLKRGGTVAAKSTIRSIPQTRTPMREQPPPSACATSPRSAAATRRRKRCASRSAACCVRTRPASRGCPVGIDIPAFIREARRQGLPRGLRHHHRRRTCCRPSAAACARRRASARGSASSRDHAGARSRSAAWSASWATARSRSLGERAVYSSRPVPGRHRRLGAGRHGLRGRHGEGRV